MSVLDHLIAAPGVYWGEGHGPGGGRFVARVALVVEGEHTVAFDYEAWSAERGLHHAESARIARSGDSVVLVATSNGGDDTMLFREGDAGVFGSVGAQRVGLVIGTGEQELTFSWWWTGRDGVLREQSRATLAPMRQIVPAPSVPADASTSSDGAESRAGSTAESGAESTAGSPADAEPEPEPDDPEPDRPQDAAHDSEAPEQADDEAADGVRDDPAGRSPGMVPPPSSGSSPTPPSVPWPGILVLNGPSTGIVAQRLAARLTRAAVVRTDLFDRAVRGTAGRPDPALRQRIALSVVQGYAATGHPVILHGASTRDEHAALAEAISRAGLSPVKLVDVAEGEDYGEVARRLIEND